MTFPSRGKRLNNRTGPWTVVLWASIACCTTGCQGPASDAPLIRRYVSATCIPVSVNHSVGPPTRQWYTELRLHNGSTVIVSGMQMPGGRIDVRDGASGRESIAANAGDYVYPSDVRVDRQNDHLYVKASGLAGGLQHQTWLFDYDLRAQRSVARLQVLDNGLPPECTEQSTLH